MLRTRKMVAARGESECATPIDITRVYASDAADRMEHSGKQVLAALADAPEAAALRDAIRALASHAARNTVVGRRRIAAAIVKAGRSSF